MKIASLWFANIICARNTNRYGASSSFFLHIAILWDFFPNASLEHPFSKEKRKNEQKSVFQFPVKWRKITQRSAA